MLRSSVTSKPEQQKRQSETSSHFKERGFASFLITLITMVVITLIVVGFATVSRREQRQQLDQLQSSQAFYAAESAVEDARHAIRQYLQANPGATIPAKDKCVSNNPSVFIYPTGNKMIVDGKTNTSFSCLKVDPSPGSLEYHDLGTNSIAVPITTSTPFTQLRFTWRPSGATGNPGTQCPTTPDATNRQFTPADKWTCQYGILRADIVPTSSGGTITGLASRQLSGFMVPVRSNASGNYNYSGNVNTSNIIASNCDTAAYTSCSVTINNITSTTSAYAHIGSLYRTSNVTIEALDSSGKSLDIIGSQIVVDATGKSTDVLRRIQVRIPAHSGNDAAPNYALATNGSICKRFSASAGYFTIPGDIVDPDDDVFTGNPMCSVHTATPPPAICSPRNDIVFVLDSSSSMVMSWNSSGTRIQELKKVTTDFVKNSKISATANHAAIVDFNVSAKLDQGLTENQGFLLGAINGLTTRAGTNYSAGLDTANAEFSSSRTRPSAQKVMIFISDGAPNDGSLNPLSPAAKDALVQKTNIMKNNGVLIYTIGIGDTVGSEAMDSVLLQKMATNTGYFADAANQAELEAILADISKDVSC